MRSEVTDVTRWKSRATNQNGAMFTDLNLNLNILRIRDLRSSRSDAERDAAPGRRIEVLLYRARINVNQFEIELIPRRWTKRSPGRLAIKSYTMAMSGRRGGRRDGGLGRGCCGS